MIAVLVATLVARRQWRPFRRWTMRNHNIAPIVVLADCVAATLWAGDLATRGSNYLFSPTWMAVYLDVTWLLLTGVGVLLIAAWPPHGPAVEPPVRRSQHHRPAHQMDWRDQIPAVTDRHWTSR
jgi:hypothetical protein